MRDLQNKEMTYSLLWVRWIAITLFWTEEWCDMIHFTGSQSTLLVRDGSEGRVEAEKPL